MFISNTNKLHREHTRVGVCVFVQLVCAKRSGEWGACVCVRGGCVLDNIKPCLCVYISYMCISTCPYVLLNLSQDDAPRLPTNEKQ